MQSESEKLKEESHRQYVNQRLGEIQVYIDDLFVDLENAWSLHNRDGLLLLSVVGTYFVALGADVAFPGMWSSVNTNVANALFWFTLGRSWIYVIPYFLGCRDELRGVFKTLEILGIIDTHTGGQKRMKKYKESAMAKLWDRLKNKARQDAYQPQPA